jgi:RimJ/RimL family protein N-acetyltransferase
MKLLKEEQKTNFSIEDIEYLSHSHYVKCENINFNVYEKNALIGNVLLYNFRPSNGNAYLSIYILKEHRKKGYGKKILNKIIEFSKNNLRMHRLTAEIYDYNKASTKLFKNAGFVLEGKIKDGKFFKDSYHDILIFGKIL